MQTKQTTTLALLVCMLMTQASAQAICTARFSGDYQLLCIQILTVGCNVLIIIEAISVGVTVLVLVLSGIQWISAEFMEDPQKRIELKQRIINAIIGLTIVMIASSLANLLLMGTLLPISC